MTKRLITGGYALFLMLCLAGFKEAKGVVSLKLAHGMGLQHPVSQSLEYFANQIKRESHGRILVDIVPSGQLGPERELIQQLQMGSLDMTKASSANLENFIPLYSVLGLPYLFETEEKYREILQGPLGREILESGAKRGLRGLIFLHAGPRSFYSVERPFLTPEDMRGVKIRVMNSKTAIDLVKALGGSPVPITYGELYTALQQRVCDAAENNIPSLYSSGHYEVAKHLILDEHSRPADVMLIGERVWRKLSFKAKKILSRVAVSTAQYHRKLWTERASQYLALMKERGLQVYPVEKTPFIERTLPLYEELSRDIKDMVKRIREAQN